MTQDTWESARTLAQKLEELEREMGFLEADIRWHEDFLRRMKVKRDLFQIKFDDLAEMRLREH